MNGVQVRIGARPSAFGVRRIRSFVLCRTAFLAGAVLVAIAQTGGVSAEAQEGVVYRPKLAVPETLQPFLKHLESGNDAFPAERQARELEARLLELADSLRGGPDRAAKIARAVAPQGVPWWPPASRLGNRDYRCAARTETIQRAIERPVPRFTRVRFGAAPAGRGSARGHGHRVPDHIHRHCR